MLRLPRADWMLIAAAACLLTVAYPPFAFGVPMFVCLVPAALLVLRGSASPSPVRRHMAQGFWYGVIVHGTLLHWLAIGLWNMGGGRIGLFPIVAAGFGVLTAVMFVLVGKATAVAPGRLVLALPAGIVALEWFTAHLGPLGFPWHQLALAATASPGVVQAADLVGSEGLSFALATINAALALAWWTRRNGKQWLAHLEVAGLLLFAMALYGLHRLNSLTLDAGASVAVIQPNIGPREKWVPGGQQSIFNRTLALTDRALANGTPLLVAWPETALPDAIASHPNWEARILQTAHRSGSTILAGAVDARPDARRYNSAVAFEPNRNPFAVHRKKQLVPIIERSLVRRDRVGFTPGDAPRVAEGRLGRYGTLLCYELTFPGMARGLRRQGATLLVTLSNDAWFGRSAAPHQHFAHAVLRAVENRVTVVRAANSGVSGIVDPLGRVVVKTTPFVAAQAVGHVQRVRSVPLAASLGAIVGPLAIVLLALLAVARPASAQRLV